jgi:hypothetical protein
MCPNGNENQSASSGSTSDINSNSNGTKVTSGPDDGIFSQGNTHILGKTNPVLDLNPKCKQVFSPLFIQGIENLNYNRHDTVQFGVLKSSKAKTNMFLPVLLSPDSSK